MLVAVKKPPTEFVIQGTIPEKFVNLLKKDYGSAVTVEHDVKTEDDGDELVDVTEMEWNNESEAKEKPGDTMRFYRRLHKMTQPALGALLGVSKQKISNMENGIVPISRQTALKLEKIFKVRAGRFI
ncbi:MAG: helix-turn-helix domain-containing protein [Treponema sp.]|jgi:DNA-binding XRE family transcriptional regulator|nr:helix-turn-helix domain-containing protein [Treponema sp.]